MNRMIRSLTLSAGILVLAFCTSSLTGYILGSILINRGASLARVMRLLASIGIFEERSGGIFALTPMGELLRSDVPGSMRSMVQLFAGVAIQDSWKELEYCVQTGEPAFRGWSTGRTRGAAARHPPGHGKPPSPGAGPAPQRPAPT